MASKPLADPTERFTNRAENYRKYRPGYPPDLYTYLRGYAGLRPSDVIADLGSGTGLLSALFLDHGHTVFGIEPNAAMRAAAEEDLAGRSSIHSLNGRAEDIPLPDDSMDFVVAGQAFHWFDAPLAKREIKRVLRPGRQVALIWNNRKLEIDDFHRQYEQLLEQFGQDYAQVSRRWVVTDKSLAGWFAPNRMTQTSLPNSRRLDRAGLLGSVLSASYMPTESDRSFPVMMAAVDELFTRHQSGGFVQFEYQTIVYHGLV